MGWITFLIKSYTLKQVLVGYYLWMLIFSQSCIWHVCWDIFSLSSPITLSLTYTFWFLVLDKMTPCLALYFHQIPTVTVAGGQQKRSGVRTTVVVSRASLCCLKKSNPAAVVDYLKKSTTIEAMCTLQISKWESSKGTKIKAS